MDYPKFMVSGMTAFRDFIWRECPYMKKTIKYLKEGVKHLLPNAALRVIQEKRQKKRDELFFEQEVFPKIPDTIGLETEYEAKSQEILRVYRKVEVCTVFAHRIGEIIVSLGHQQEFPPKEGELAIFFPVGWIPREGGEQCEYLYEDRYIANIYLYQKVAAMLPLVTRENAGFWKYFIQHYKHRTYVSHRFDHQNLLAMQKKILQKKNFHRQYLHFEPDERKEGEKKLEEMGLAGKKYVCFFARQGRYLREFLGIAPSDVDPARNSHVENFGLMSKCLWQRGIHSVRMGHLVEEAFNAPGAVDYANHYRSEFMDFYVLSQALFLISDTSAMEVMANLFDKPLVMVNMPVITFNADSLNYCDRKQDIFLPKKMYDTHRKRYLTFREIFAIERQEDSRYKIAEYYEAHGIVLEENTPEELADAAEEMIARLDGTFSYTPEDEIRQKRFSELLAWATEGRVCFVVDLPVGREFLRQNEWLLEL